MMFAISSVSRRTAGAFQSVRLLPRAARYGGTENVPHFAPEATEIQELV